MMKHDTIALAELDMEIDLTHRDRSWLIWAGLGVLLASNLPYLIAWVATPVDYHFTGLVFNPIDGHSYLAKMRQGLEGSWRYHLAFTPERSPGAAIYLYHLLLGHVARWTRLPLIAVYHGARILAGVLMLAGIYALASCLSDRHRDRGTMFLLTALGSGVGWLVSTAGIQTADLWVPEAFPFYSLMANAHFPLAVGLMIGVGLFSLRLTSLESDVEGSALWPWGLGMALGALALSAIQPFGLVPLFGGLGTVLASRIATSLRSEGVSFPWRAAAWFAGTCVLALPYPIYMQAGIRSDPALNAWSAQNVTSSPPLWDWALSYGLLLVLAVLGGTVSIKRGSDSDVFLLGWALVTLVGMIVPFPLQRRVSLGLGVPVGLLAGLGWCRVVRPRIYSRRRSLWRGVSIALSSLTMLFLIAMVSAAALSGEPWFYLTSGEWAALGWLREEGKSEAVVLCAPQTGTFVPAWAGQRVVYGHPFETVNAEERRDQVEAYWSQDMSSPDRAEFLRENGVELLMIGPREREFSAGTPAGPEFGRLAFESEDTRVFSVRER